MSKKTKEKKEAKAQEPEAPKPSIPNADRCCHCKSYAKFPDGQGHMCKRTGKPTPRKATCPEHKFRG